MERTSASLGSSGVSQGNQNATASTTHYEVFMNHRGPDVKRTLASLVYQWLQDKGLQVFLDKAEFQPGQPLSPTIEDAIRTASVHIAIFSSRYAESDWCLKELCLILQTGAPIIPLFYDVGPQDLRWVETGEYASAFDKHEKKNRYDSQTISNWKSALHEVSYFSGLEFCKGEWGQLFKRLEDAVFQNLKPVVFEVATDPVGLDEAVCHFESFMDSHRQNEKKEVKIVGIVGLGGSGKTTLAKEFFNRKSPSFERSTFLFDLRDASNRNALPSLQKKLLEDLAHLKDCKIDNVSEGKGIIRQRLQSLTPNALIVLDDIDHPSQVENLLVKDVLGSGSLIIITSRDEEALKLSEASIYRIQALSPEHARHLFCKHAFQLPHPILGFENLVEKFSEKCGRLPLFLKVTGAHLRVNVGNDTELWNNELNYIHKDILNVLYSSYNALSKEEKQIFLDIACFFLGDDKDLALNVWDKCEGRAWFRLNTLVNKCLVEFDRNRFKMHDHVRDFGRAIADVEPPYRMWNESQAENFPEQPEATREFRGIMAATSPFSWCESFYKPPLEGIELSTLKMLVMEGHCFDEQLGGNLKNLVWLRLFRYPRTSISPSLISMKNLTVLELYGGEIQEWPLHEQVHLRELRIVDTNLSLISIPHNVYPRLEHLYFSGNWLLKEIKHLPHGLLKLELVGCRRLEELQGVDHLPQLRKLDISCCPSLREFASRAPLMSLQQFGANGCWELQSIQGLGELQKLNSLTLSTYHSRAIWNVIENMKKLPRRMYLGVRARGNSLNLGGLSVIDLLEGGQFPALVEEDPTTSFMLCFVVDFGSSCEWMEVTIVDKNGEAVVEFETLVEEGEWVYALISSKQSNYMECLHTTRVRITYHFYNSWDSPHEDYEDHDYFIIIIIIYLFIFFWLSGRGYPKHTRSRTHTLRLIPLPALRGYNL